MSTRRAIIIGAGPAGLTAAYELLRQTDVVPLVLEQDDQVGGISRTVNYKGNRIDIGGHRFFSRSDRVMDWWTQMLPVERLAAGDVRLGYQNKTRDLLVDSDGPDPAESDDVMLVRPRRSRIYYDRKFYDYPISLSGGTLANLGLVRTGRIGASYFKARARPIAPETNLEEFLINRFGRELYATFFQSYTEKVWGVPCDRISAEWGAQRIKGLSVGKAVMNALAKPFRAAGGIGQKGVETSLIEQFLYPKFGPGQMWETCARKVEELGGEVRLRQRIEGLRTEGERVVEVTVRDLTTQQTETIAGDYVFSTMPMKTLARSLDVDLGAEARTVGEGLVYRDFVTVGLLLPELKIRDRDAPDRPYPSDNWIYIQEPDVRVGRLQIFNNWSPWMVADRRTVWIGLEYFCNAGDDIWTKPDDEMAEFGARELAKIGIIDAAQVRDATVIRVPKTYPAYFGSYDRFDALRERLDRFENLFLIGRNGMHRYNNQDHSMLTAMTAVENIVAERTDKRNIWDVNTEQEYHEDRATAAAAR